MPCGLLPEPNSLSVRNRMHEQKQNMFQNVEIHVSTLRIYTYLYVFIFYSLGDINDRNCQDTTLTILRAPAWFQVTAVCNRQAALYIRGVGGWWWAWTPPDWSNTVPRVSPTEAPPSCLQRARICCWLLHWVYPYSLGLNCKSAELCMVTYVTWAHCVQSPKEPWKALKPTEQFSTW